MLSKMWPKEIADIPELAGAADLTANRPRTCSKKAQLPSGSDVEQ